MKTKRCITRVAHELSVTRNSPELGGVSPGSLSLCESQMNEEDLSIY
jgi:hypothetical protein